MKIVFISQLAPPDYSGAGVAIAHTARLLKSRGAEVFVLATRSNGRVATSGLLPGNVPIRRFRGNFSPLFHLCCALWLLRHLAVATLSSSPICPDTGCRYGYAPGCS